MTTENHDNLLTWKDRLNALSSISNDSPDQNKLWSRLEARLPAGRNNKKHKWYWLAAASITGILVTMIIQTQHRSSINQTDFLISKKTNHVTNQKEIKINASTPSSKKQETGFSKGNKISVAVKGYTAYSSKQAVLKIKKHQLQIISDSIHPIAHISESPEINSLATIAPVQKKLAIIHINELGKQGKENPVPEKDHEFSIFKIKFAKRNISGSSVNNNTDENIFKIKLSQN